MSVSVSEIADRLSPVQWNISLDQALEKMQQTNLNVLPVTNQDEEFLGLISEDEIYRAQKFDDIPLKTELVGNWMTTTTPQISSRTELATVAKRMIEEKCQAFAVVDGNEVTGILTSTDLLRVLVRLLEGTNSGLNSAGVGELESLTYDSPIGNIVHLLSQVGI